MRSFRTYKEILLKRGICYSIHEAWKKIQRFHFIKDNRILELQNEYNAYRHLKRYARVLKYNTLKSKELPSPINPYPDKIWVSWLQGEEQAPALVKKCIASIRKYAGEREVIVITDKNMAQYVNFPEYILRKKAKGRISNTHFSDLLRIFLLAQYGGIWIDSTVYLTAPIPDYILNAPLFCYKAPLAVGKIKASSWFIAAERHQEIIMSTKRLLEEYWKRKNYLQHYYLFHLLFAVAIDSSKQLTRQWQAVPNFNSANPHVLQSELDMPYSSTRWEQIKSFSPIHKLTYKLNSEVYERPNTFLQMILNS